MAIINKGNNKKTETTTEEKGKKNGKSPVEKLYKKVNYIARIAHKAQTQVDRWKADSVGGAGDLVDLTGFVQTAAQALTEAASKLTTLHEAGFVPPRATRGANNVKVELAEGVKVHIKDKYLDGLYAQAFSKESLDDLYVDRIVGTKALVRIGERSSDGKVARLIGFVPKGHLTVQA